MSIITWNKKLMSVGIEEIDLQHKKLIDLLNKVIISIQNGNQIQDIEKFIDVALEYIKYHFSAEEKYFKNSNMEEKDIFRHKEEHKFFIKKINDLHLKLKDDYSFKSNYGIEITTELNSLLSKWIVHHILVEDKKAFTQKN